MGLLDRLRRGHPPVSVSVTAAGTGNSPKFKGEAVPPRSRADRLTSDPKIEGILEAAQEVLGKKGLAKLLRSYLGNAVIDDLAAAVDEQTEFIQNIDADSCTLAEHGWLLPEIIVPLAGYRAAADAYRSGDASAAEEVLTNAWTETVRRSVTSRISSLYPDEADFPIALAREQLLDEASALHEEGRYAGAIPIVLAQCDGSVGDVLGGHRLLFHKGKGLLVNESTLSGHPDALDALSEAMTKGPSTTRLGGRFDRHAVMHGRDVGYATPANTCRAWTLAAGTIEVLQRHLADEAFSPRGDVGP